MLMRQTILAIMFGLSTTASYGDTVVYDTLSDTPVFPFLTYNIGVPPTSPAPPRSTAMRFVPSEGGFLSTIEVSLLEIAGVEWSLSATIYPDVAGLPGQTGLESIAYTGGQAGFSGNLSLAASGTTWLDPSAAYWLGLAPETDGMFIGWSQSNLATTGMNKAQTWAELDGFWFSILPDENQAGFLISANTAIPIPAAAWLFGSALGLLGWRGSRKSCSTTIERT